MTSRKIARDYLAKVEARAEASERLFAERGHAFDGDEDDLVPPSERFERTETEATIAIVERLLALDRELLASAND